MAERSKSKAVNVHLIDPTGKAREPYVVLARMVSTHRDDLRDTRFVLYWHTKWIPNADGNVPLVKVSFRHDRERLVADYDIAIEINKEAWDAAPLGSNLHEAMILHAISFVQLAHDSDGEEKVDENGLAVFRRATPDVVEFTNVVAVFGSYTDKLRQFSERLAAQAKADPAPERQAKPRRSRAAKPATAQG